MERIDEEENAVMDEMNIFQPRAPFSGMHDDMEVNEVSLGKYFTWHNILRNLPYFEDSSFKHFESLICIKSCNLKQDNIETIMSNIFCVVF